MKQLTALTTGVLLWLGSNALAQQHVSFNVPSQNSKYIVSQNVDVGDVPNHLVRVFDIHYTVANVSINGLKITEMFLRGTADITNGRGGSNSVYFMLVAENGDKLFSRANALVQPGSTKLNATQVGT
jgi:hypothetical protein